MNIKEVNWKARYPSRGVDAKEAHAELKRLEESDPDAFCAATIVERASKEGNVLHPIICHLNDEDAAYAHRLEEARKLLCAFDLVYEEAPTLRTRAFEVVVVKPRGEGTKYTTYASADKALENPEVRERLLKDALTHLEQWRNRYGTLSELGDICKAIDKVLVDA